MKVVNQEGVEIQEYDLETGKLVPSRLLVQHHEAVEFQAAQYEDQLVEEYENGGRLYNHICVSPAVQGKPAWDEYEDVKMYVPYTKEELEEIQKQKEAEEQAKKEEEEQAKKLKEQQEQEHRMNLAVRTMSKMMIPTISTMSLSNAAVAPLAPLYPEWDENSYSYKEGEPFYYVIDGETRYFRASQDTVSTPVYKPGDVGTTSIYYEIFIAPDGIEIWQTVQGKFNAPNKGDRLHYPNEDSPIYESLVDGNAYSPDVYPNNWKLVE